MTFAIVRNNAIEQVLQDFDPFTVATTFTATVTTVVEGEEHTEERTETDDVQYPPGWVQGATDEQRTALGIVTVTPAGSVPEGKVVAGPSTYTLAGNVVQEVLDLADAPALSPEELIGALMGAGVAVRSTSTPALNGTYSLDPSSQANISGVAVGIASRNRLPGGGSTFNYGDAIGTNHSFTAEQFLNFATAVEDYVYAVLNGSRPATPLEIA